MDNSALAYANMAGAQPMTHEQRRRLIESPIPIRIVGNGYGWAGVYTQRDALTRRHLDSRDLDVIQQERTWL